eukprot:GHVU01122516.1.p1 GENE.GHVU01122516.1~~GHVU01122516.1.p1  ORF type:complete len:131 (-),score=9.48 GHVU01122516.1:589-981(-)
MLFIHTIDTVVPLTFIRPFIRSFIPGPRFIGCFADDDNNDLKYHINTRMELRESIGCLNECQAYGYRYAAVQFSSAKHETCFCADAYGTQPQYQEKPTAECNASCKLGSSLCGGPLRNSIFALKGMCDRP